MSAPRTIHRVEQIGDCTLYLGDAASVLPDIGEMLGRRYVDSVVTDPPYGMEFRSNFRQLRHDAIEGDNNVQCLQWAVGLSAKHSKYIFCRWDNIPDLLIKPKSLITWVKNNWSMGDLEHEHARQTECIAFYAGATHAFPDGRPQDVVTAARSSNEHHPSEKPVPLMCKIVRWTAGEVFDPFMGSGSTGVACVKLGRKFIGVEVHEPYFDIALRRIEDATRQVDMFIQKADQPEAHQPSLLGEIAA